MGSLVHGYLASLLVAGALALPHPIANSDNIRPSAMASANVQTLLLKTVGQTLTLTATHAGTTSTGHPPWPTARPSLSNRLSGRQEGNAIAPADNACASIRSLQQEFYVRKGVDLNNIGPMGPSVTYTAPFALITNCLASVPLDTEKSLQHIEMLKRYAHHHSTLSVLKNPPESAKNLYPKPVDIIGDLDALAERVKAGKVASHAELEFTITKIFASAHDGHLKAVGSVSVNFDFRGPFDLVSISEDGKKLPKVYPVTPLDEEGSNIRIGNTAIVKIDGKSAAEFITDVMDAEGFQSVDARYNKAFISKDLLGKTVVDSGFHWLSRQPERETMAVTYENGTTVTYKYAAVVSRPMDDIKSGQDIFNKFVIQKKPDEDGQTEAPIDTGDDIPSNSEVSFKFVNKKGLISKLMSERLLPIKALAVDDSKLPTPVAQVDRIFAGYFLEGTDAAVLRITSFYAGAPASRAVAEFLALCREKKKTNLIIDAQSNVGGSILLGYDIFVQLFPNDKVMSTQGNLRLTESTRIMIDAAKDVDNEDFVDLDKKDPKVREAFAVAAGIALAWRGPLDAKTMKHFTSAQDYMGPNVLRGDKYTKMWTYDITNKNLGLNLTPEFNSDYFSETPPPQPFKAENIIFVTDGSCSSTCSTLAEYLRKKNVRTVALGGLPQLKQMEHVGGVRGMQIADFTFLQEATRAVEVLSPSKDNAEKQHRKSILPADFPFQTYGNINWANLYRKDEDVPLQFIEDPADCKLFYTREMIKDVTKLWGRLSDMAFGKDGAASSGEGCAVGTLKRKNQ